MSEYKDNYNSAKSKFECKNCTIRSQPIKLNQLNKNYSTTLSKAKSEIEKKDIQKTIYNDQFSLINPTKESDYMINYLKPDKSFYRKKRTDTYYPKYECSSVEKNSKSEYNSLFTNFGNEKNKF